MEQEWSLCLLCYEHQAMQETWRRRKLKSGSTKPKISRCANQSLWYFLRTDYWKLRQSLPTWQRNQKLCLCHEISSFQTKHPAGLLWRWHLYLVWYLEHANHSRNNRIWNLLNRLIYHEQCCWRWFFIRWRLHSIFINLWNVEFVLNSTSQSHPVLVHKSSAILYLWW